MKYFLSGIVFYNYFSTKVNTR